MPKPPYDTDEAYAADTWADEKRQRDIEDAILERQPPAAGEKPRMENHPNRQVHRGRFPNH